MNPTLQPLCFEDRDFAVLTYRVVRETSVGTLWRFITKYETVVVVPCQTAAAPAGEPPCVPNFIFPVLCGPGKKTLAALVRRIVKLETPLVGSSDRDAELEKEVRACLARYGIEKLTKPKLRAIIEYTWNLFPALGRPVVNLEIGGREMRQVLAKIQEVSGRDISSAVKLDCTPNFAESARAWAARAAKLQGTSERAALRLLLGKVKYVGVPPGGIAIPLESVISDVHDAQDGSELLQFRHARGASEMKADRGPGIPKQEPANNRETGTARKVAPYSISRQDGKVIFRALSPEFARVEFNGVIYDAPPKGRSVIGIYVRELETNRCTFLSAERVLSEIGRGGETLADAFKGYRNTWNALFRAMPGRRGLYEFVPGLIANGGEISRQSPG